MSRLILELKTQNVSDPTDVIAEALAIAKKFNIFVDLEIDYYAYRQAVEPAIENHKFRMMIHPGIDTVSGKVNDFKYGVEHYKKCKLKELQQSIQILEEELQKKKDLLSDNIESK